MKISKKNYDELGYALTEIKGAKHDIIDTVQAIGHYHHCSIKYSNQNNNELTNPDVEFYLTHVNLEDPTLFAVLKLRRKLKKLSFKEGVKFLLNEFHNNSVNILNQLPLAVFNDEAFINEIIEIVKTHQDFDVKKLLDKIKSEKELEIQEIRQITRELGA